MIYLQTRKELKTLNASDCKEGDIIKTGKYYIHIHYGGYKRPSLCSWVEREDFRKCNTPGVNIPYYIDDFLGR